MVLGLNLRDPGGSTNDHIVPVKEKLTATLIAFKQPQLIIWMPAMLNFGVQYFSS